MVELENKSKREAEALLSEITGVDLKPKEQVRAISKEEVRLQLTIPKELLEKLDKIKALRAHKNPKQDYISLLTDMSDYILKKIDPTAQVIATPAKKKAVVRTTKATADSGAQSEAVARTVTSMKATPPAVARISVTCGSFVTRITKAGMRRTYPIPSPAPCLKTRQLADCLWQS